MPNKKLPCVRQLRQWVKDYESGGLQIDALMSESHKSGNRTQRFNLEERSRMTEVIGDYTRTERPTNNDAVRIIRDRFFEDNLERAKQGLPLAE